MAKKPPVPPIISTVIYCCGGCGYDLKLSSTARDVEAGWRRRCRRRGVAVFDAIDDLRFGHLEEFRCLDVRALRLFARRTRLLCRKCGAHLGYGYHDTDPPRYHIKVRAVRPAADAYPSPYSPEDPAAAAAREDAAPADAVI